VAWVTKAGEGKVATPLHLALYMVDKLFRGRPPAPGSRVLDAGCGSGVFVEAVVTWVRRRGLELPEVVCVEVDPRLVEVAREKFKGVGAVRVLQLDFLTASEEDVGGKFDYIISNPPYISYEKIDPALRELYRRLFKVAVGRFDTYMLFFEKALALLKPGGRLVFVTPEKFLYVLSARELRRLLAEFHVEEVELVDEDVFGDVLAYPAITVVVKEPPGETRIRLRDGSTVVVSLPRDGSPWLAYAVARAEFPSAARRLEDLALRISAGVATGRDEVFVVPRSSLPKELEPFAYPTVSGRELAMFKPGEAIDYGKLKYVMLVPYDANGRLLSEREAKSLIDYLSKHRRELESRHVVKTGKKAWYAFHEDPPLRDILRPKILWSDIAREPAFFVDVEGRVVPRHSVYYLVPKDPKIIPRLVAYLNGGAAREWLKRHCQRAANGYYRLQSHVLKNLPIPDDLLELRGGEADLRQWLWARRF